MSVKRDCMYEALGLVLLLIIESTALLLLIFSIEGCSDTRPPGCSILDSLFLRSCHTIPETPPVVITPDKTDTIDKLDDEVKNF